MITLMKHLVFLKRYSNKNYLIKCYGKGDINMNKTTFGIGSHSLEGDYKNIFIVGDLNILNSNISHLTVLGDTNISHSKIKKMKCIGNTQIKEGEIIKGKLRGKMIFSGICKVNHLSIYGSVDAEYLECNVLKGNCLRNDNTDIEPIWKGYIKSNTLEIIDHLKFEFDYDITSILSLGDLFSEQPITCEYFYSFGNLKAPEINADHIFILTSDQLEVQNLFGSNIVISNQFHPDTFFDKIPKTEKYKKKESTSQSATLSTIEGDSIQLDHVICDYVSGNTVNIQDFCTIDKIEYKNDIHISEKSTVKEVLKV